MADPGPKACDAPIASWRKAGKLTRELVWGRIALAMEAGSLDLAKYLERFLPASDRAAFDFLMKVHSDPGTWLPTLERRRVDDINKAIFVHGIRRLSGGDANRAAEIWKENRDRYDFSTEEACVVDGRLAIALEDEPDLRSYAFFQQLKPCENQPRMLESRVRAALLQRDWPTVERWIEELPKNMRENERWLYWKARALEAQGQEKPALALYETAAKERTYYGFLAADKIGKAYRSDHNKIDAGDEVLAQVKQLPGIQRMRELYGLDRFVDARREWLVLIPELDRSQLLAASQIFDEWGWLDRAHIHRRAGRLLGRSGTSLSVGVRRPGGALRGKAEPRSKLGIRCITPGKRLHPRRPLHRRGTRIDAVIACNRAPGGSRERLAQTLQ